MSVVERTLGPQVLLRGQVRDALTNAGLDATLVLEFDQGAGFAPLPFVPRKQQAGLFAVAARLTEFSARMQIGKAVAFRLTATANGYQAQAVSKSLTAAKFARKAAIVMVGGVAVPSETIAAAPVILEVLLKPLPIMLAGQVLSDSDFAAPVAGASVEIKGPGGALRVTDANGRFRFDAPPLTISVPMRVTLGPRVAEAVHVFDYATPINFKMLNLPTN